MLGFDKQLAVLFVSVAIRYRQEVFVISIGSCKGSSTSMSIFSGGASTLYTFTVLSLHDVLYLFCSFKLMMVLQLRCFGFPYWVMQRRTSISNLLLLICFLHRRLVLSFFLVTSMLADKLFIVYLVFNTT